VICDFIYTKEGLRVPSGDAVITITGPDGVTRTLVVVRSGKGRSRLDRWSDKPRPDGVVGEINTRDLQEWMELSNSREIPGKITVDGVELDVMLDSEAMVGRAGRQSEGFRDYLAGLNPESQRAAALLMIKGSPYGTEHTEDFRDGVDAALETLSEDDVRALIESGEMNFLAHCSEDFIEKHHKTLSSEELSAKIACEPSLSERVASVKRVIDAIDKFKEMGDLAFGGMLGNLNLSKDALLRLVSSGSRAAAGVLVKLAPEETLKIARDLATPAETRTLLLYQLAVSKVKVEPGDIKSALGGVELARFLRENVNYWISSSGGIDYDESDIMRSIVARVLFESGGLACSTEIREAFLERDWASIYRNIHRMPPVREEASNWANKLPPKTVSNLTPEQARDVAEILLKAERDLRGLTYVTYGEFMSASSVDTEKTTKIEHGLSVMRVLEPEKLEDILSGRESIDGGGLLITTRGELLAAASSSAHNASLISLMSHNSSETSRYYEEDASFKHRPAYGLMMSRQGKHYAAEWLTDLSNTVALDLGRNDVTPNLNRVVRELSDSEYSSCLPASVAVSIACANDASLERDILKITSGVAKTRKIDAVREKLDNFYSMTSTYSGDVWRETEDSGMSTNERLQVSVAVSIRTGVALGTDNVETLEDIMNNEREYDAGPVAALRILGHHALRPLSKPPTAKQTERARVLLDKHHDYDPTDSSAKSYFSGELYEIIRDSGAVFRAFEGSSREHTKPGI
jgi:hypothetical protein